MNQTPIQPQTQLMMQEQSTGLIELAQNEPHSALKCLHLLSVAGGATRKAYQAIAARIMADDDTTGAYHLVLMAQTTPDLPIDARQLIELILEHGEPSQLLALLKNLPLPPTEHIREKILASKNDKVIEQMQHYLHQNPDGYGSQKMLASGQKDRIVPLSQPLT